MRYFLELRYDGAAYCGWQRQPDAPTVQQTIEQSGGRIVTQEGSLYPVLYKLLDQGYISDRRVQVGRRMTRIYYHLEPAGAQRLQELIGEYRQISQGIDSIIGGNEK